jgi:hypothetical protein
LHGSGEGFLDHTAEVIKVETHAKGRKAMKIESRKPRRGQVLVITDISIRN